MKRIYKCFRRTAECGVAFTQKGRVHPGSCDSPEVCPAITYFLLVSLFRMVLLWKVSNVELLSHFLLYQFRKGFSFFF